MPVIAPPDQVTVRGVCFATHPAGATAETISTSDGSSTASATVVWPSRSFGISSATTTVAFSGTDEGCDGDVC